MKKKPSSARLVLALIEATKGLRSLRGMTGTRSSRYERETGRTISDGEFAFLEAEHAAAVVELSKERAAGRDDGPLFAEICGDP